MRCRGPDAAPASNVVVLLIRSRRAAKPLNKLATTLIVG
jgi:hypothetical protein